MLSPFRYMKEVMGRYPKLAGRHDYRRDGYFGES